MSAETEARLAAAVAVLTDYEAFRASDDGRVRNGSGLAWQYWADRLADVLDPVLKVGLTGDDLRTVLDALDVAADYKRDLAANCPDCDTDPSDLCSTCEWRLHVADGYDALARRLEDR